MDPRLLHYYRQELRFLWDLGAEFAAQHEDIAARLDLKQFPCPDPYVERLLEGFAFLAARVHLKLDAEFPRFTQHLLELIFPDYVAPTPSMALVELRPDRTVGTLADGITVTRGTSLISGYVTKNTPCEYRTAHDVTLWPLELVEVRHLTGAAMDAAGVPPRADVAAALRLRLRTFGEVPVQRLPLERLTFCLPGNDAATLRLYEALFAHGVGVAVQPAELPVGWRHVAGRRAIRRVGFDDDQALLPCDRRSFQGYRLLKEYFAFPQRFMFVELGELGPGVRRCEADRVDLLVLFDRPEHDLDALSHAAGAGGEPPLTLFATPAVNLFKGPDDRVHLDGREREHHVVPNRAAPMDYEVYKVTQVTGIGARDRDEQVFRPFYDANDATDLGGEQGYYTVRREPRLPSSRERQSGRRSSYVGSEVYLSLVDANEAPWRHDLRLLKVSTLCTNRDLPLDLPGGGNRGTAPGGEGGERSDFTVSSGDPVAAARCLAGPTAPGPAVPDGEHAWRLIGHLSLNYLSLTDDGVEGRGAAALRELLRLYGDVPTSAWGEGGLRAVDRTVAQRIDGLRAVQTRPVVRPVPGSVPITFGRGLEVTLTLEERAFQGTGAFLFGAVLERFLAKYVSINAFTETVVRTLERGEIMRWPARSGRRQLM